jgi:hypothetical protein
MGGLRTGCRELHTGELYTRPQQVGQVEAEVILVADQAFGPVMVEVAAVSLTTGGRHSANCGARAYADGGSTRADAGANRAHAYATEGRAGGAVELMQMGKIKVSLSFIF